MYKIITSFNEKYWQEVADENTKFLDANWAENQPVIFYHELNHIPTHGYSKRVRWLDLYDNCPLIEKFIEEWKDHPNANGAKNFRTNAVKFVHKTFAIWHACKTLDSGWLVWIDSDACLYKSIDINFIHTVFPNDKMICYLGRPGKYSECGFLGFNLDHKECKTFLSDWEDLYLSGKFINLPETHDSWTFDFIRKKYEQSLFHNLNASATTNKNPFSQSLIGPYFAHAKGDKKNEKLQKIKLRTNL